MRTQPAAWLAVADADRDALRRLLEAAGWRLLDRPTHAAAVPPPASALVVAEARAWHDGRAIALTPTEVELLHALAIRAGEPVERAVLAERLPHCATNRDARAVDVMVSRLRRRLIAQGVHDIEIRAVRRRGYCLLRIAPR